MTGVDMTGLRVELGGRAVVDGVGLTVAAGEVLGIVGPNGSGKTTLLRTLYRALDPTSGRVLIDGDDIGGLPRRELARRLAAAVQDPGMGAALRVVDVVAQGRYAHRGMLESLREEDHQAVDAAIDAVGVKASREQDVRTLSGGEAQRVSIARALAQDARVLVLDEPTNHLDLRHQLTVLDTVRELAGSGLAVLLTLHDLHLAVRYCDRVAVLDRGRLVGVGEPGEVLTERVLAEVFGVRATVFRKAGRWGMDVEGLA